MEIDFTPSPDLYPFESHWFESSVGPVHYIDEGQGRQIVFCHGQPTWSFLYRKLVLGLRDRYRCVAVDLPGFGFSARPDGYGYTPKEHAGVLGELVDSLELSDMVVMGQDWGGPIILSVAASRPQRVSGIVLGNTWFWAGDLQFRIFGTLMSTGFMQRRIVEKNFFVETMMPRLARLPDDVMDHYRGVQATLEARRGLGEFPRQLTRSSSWLVELSQAVPKHLGSKPALIVWGMKDMAFRAKRFIPRMQATFPDHVVVELPKSSHLIQEDAPEEIIRAIADLFPSAEHG